jgi:hypothetical protein
VGPEDGWLIGEAVAEDNALRGTIAFYPYRYNGMLPFAQPPQAAEKPAPQQGRRDWQPKRIAP